MFDVRARRLIAAAALSTAFPFATAYASQQPADPCSLLPAAEASKTLGHAYAAPARSVAPRPFRDTAEGTDCIYKGGAGTLMFRVYFDASPSQSADLFKRLKMFFGTPAPVPGVGDDTYFDSRHALHERKGNVRFYLELSGDRAPAPAKEKMLVDLANGIGGRL